MKRMIAMLLALAMVFALCACGKMEASSTVKESAASKPEETVETPEPTPVVTPEPTPNYLSTAEIVAMSNYMCQGRTAFSGSWVYSWDWYGNRGALSKFKTDGEEETMLSREYTPYNITVDGAWLYYLGINHSSRAYSINKIRLSGADEEILVSGQDLPGTGVIQHFFLYQDYLYFACNDESGDKITGGLYRSDKDGKNVTLVLDKAVYYPYIVYDKLYYQDDADDCRIHVCNPDGTDDQVFIDDFSYDFISNGVSFLYLSYIDPVNWDENHRIPDEQNMRRAIKVFTPGKGSRVIADVNAWEFAFDGSTIYYSDRDDSGRLYSYDLSTNTVELLSQDDYAYDICILGTDLISYFDYSSSNYVDNIYVCKKDGTDKFKIA